MALLSIAGADMNVCLANFGHCNFVSPKHATIFYDGVSASAWDHLCCAVLTLVLCLVWLCVSQCPTSRCGPCGQNIESILLFLAGCHFLLSLSCGWWHEPSWSLQCVWFLSLPAESSVWTAKLQWTRHHSWQCLVLLRFLGQVSASHTRCRGGRRCSQADQQV